jgi:hypothetical protein
MTQRKLIRRTSQRNRIRTIVLVTQLKQVD